MTSWMKVMKDIAWLTQLGFSAITPPILCVAVAYWLVNSLQWPTWIIIIALLFGLGGSAVSFWGFYQYMIRKSAKSQKKAPPAFNKHF